MNIQGKIWGTTSEIFNKNNVEVHRIEAKKGGYSSIHKHEHKYNMFFVETGMLKIEIWKNDYDLLDTLDISAGHATIVMPGEYHRFTAERDTIAYEFYWTELSSKDIVRKDCGGILND
jgi:quercetin dioxygenase-like cupin family protein